MQLSADFNWEVCVPTTAAQIYHLLRRQMLRKQRKPLVVMTPKSLLRFKGASSPLSDLADGTFQTVIPEIDHLDVKKIKRIVVCSGKVYFDLLARRREKALESVAIIRVEQLYPFDDRCLADILKQYPSWRELIWCQEEPLNQGAWYAKTHRLQGLLKKGQTLDVVARPASASPAVGYAAKHVLQQREVVDAALGINE